MSNARGVATLATLITCLAAPVNAQVGAFLDAPHVKKFVRVHADGKTLRYVLDNDIRDPSGLPLAQDQLFLASDAIKVLYWKLNPLSVHVTAGVTTADDPSYAALSKLIDTIVGIPPIVKPALAAATPTAGPLYQCEKAQDASALLKTLQSTLYGDLPVKEQVAKWIAIIDGQLNRKAGADGVSDAQKAMRAFLNGDPSNPSEPGLTARITEATKRVETLEEKLKNLSAPTTLCDAIANDAYRAMALTNPRARLGTLTLLQKAIQDLDASLKPFADPSMWVDGAYYVVTKDGVRPAADKIQIVTVKVATLKIESSLVDPSITITDAELASGVFDIRKYGVFTAELGMGATFANVVRPKYGTGKDPVKGTIVTRVDESVEIQPTVMVNFICRCHANLFEPMIQVGASASKDTPSVFLGGGLRLFRLPGKGDVALGVGGALTWIKELKGLSEGDPVSGTTEIENKLQFRNMPKPGWYVSLLYKFGT